MGNCSGVSCHFVRIKGHLLSAILLHTAELYGEGHVRLFRTGRAVAVMLDVVSSCGGAIW